MRVTVTSYWKIQLGTPPVDHATIEHVEFEQVGLGNPKGVVVPGQDPNDRFMHIATSTPVREIPVSIPTAFNPLDLPIKAGFTQINKAEYDSIILAKRQANPTYDPTDYI